MFIIWAEFDITVENHRFREGQIFSTHNIGSGRETGSKFFLLYTTYYLGIYQTDCRL
jgi:hypothetical protein